MPARSSSSAPLLQHHRCALHRRLLRAVGLPTRGAMRCTRRRSANRRHGRRAICADAGYGDQRAIDHDQSLVVASSTAATANSKGRVPGTAVAERTGFGCSSKLSAGRSDRLSVSLPQAGFGQLSAGVGRRTMPHWGTCRKRSAGVAGLIGGEPSMLPISSGHRSADPGVKLKRVCSSAGTCAHSTSASVRQSVNRGDYCKGEGIEPSRR